MKPFILRVLWLFGALFVATLLIGAAGLAGRASAAPIAAVQIDDPEPDRVSYMLVDVDRRVSTARGLTVPQLVDERWYAQPPLVLQRVTRGESADWTLSTVEMYRNTLSPVLRLTTDDNVRIRIPDFLVREMPDGTLRYFVYVPHSGEIWTAAPEQPDGVPVAAVTRGLMYPLSVSPDGTMLAVNGAGELTVMNADGSDVRTFEGLQTPAWMTWSPDGRKLLASPVDLYSREHALAIDVRRGERLVLDGARLAISCGAGYVAITEQANGFGITSITEDGESRVILDPETLNGLEPAGIIQLEPEHCDWLVISNRRGEALLVHTDSGEWNPLGTGFRVIRMDGGTMTYRTHAGEMTEIRQIALDTGARPEIRWTYPRTFAEIGWLDGGADRGLFIHGGLLKLIERGGESVLPLNGASAEFYSLLEN
jgi:hypothetical protein